MRIAVAGFHHETNTFAPTRATYDLFERIDGWPGLQRGPEMLDVMPGRNIGMGGFIEAAKPKGHELVPLVWANANPSSYVTEDAYERISAMLLEDLEKVAGDVDALYLDLHGAMVPEHLPCGEGELLERVRKVVGADLPIVVSLDLHANVSRKMVDNADLMVAYRTYPHVDMAETGGRALALLEQIVAEGKPAKAFRQLDFLISINWQCTTIEPGKTVYRRLAEIEKAHRLVSASFTPGFPPADTPDCGPAIFTYASDQVTADKAADELVALIEGERDRFDGRYFSPDEAVAEARRQGGGDGPVIIADTQDNPGGGGDGVTTGMLKALVDAKATDAAIGMLVDPELAKRAHEAGEGGTVEGGIGDGGVSGTFRVERLGDGKFTCRGPMYRGATMDLGPMACLVLGDIRIAVGSKKVQAADREIFRHVGIQPEEVSVLVLKSSVHFRADFQPIASAVLLATAPGPVTADPKDLAYKALRKGVRLGPSGPVFEGAG